MRGLKEKDELYAEIGEDGAVHVEKHYVGRLKGFRFVPDAQAEGIHGKATRNAATHVLARELGMRVRRVASAKNDAFKLTRQAQVLWRDEEIARLEAGEDPLKPTVVVLADEHLSAPDKARLQERLNAWIAELIGERLKPLVEIDAAQDIAGLARGIAFRLKENFGVLQRESIAEEVRSLDQPARAQLRKYGVRFGAFNIYFPALLKPASSELAAILWVLKRGAEHRLDIAAMPDLPRAGLTSMPLRGVGGLDAFYRVAGYHVCGPRAVRVDMLERLADLIRVLLGWRLDPANPSLPPKGATGDGGFKATPDMMSILGCSADELGNVLKALGFWADRRRVPVAPSVAAPAVAPEQSPAKAEAAVEAPGAQTGAAETPAGTAEPPAATVSPPESIAVAEPGQENAAVGTAEPAPAPEPEAPAAAAASPSGEAPPAPAEEKWEEVWRPRRKGRSFERPDQERRAHRPRHRGFAKGAPKPPPQPSPGDKAPDAAQAQPSKPMRQAGKHHQSRRDQGRKGSGRRDEPRRPHLQASPPRAKAAFDPDSPFAALSSLKAAMEERGQE
jgi:ATP-dependent RNA helicase SUPV3L1/SUV3